MTVHGLDPEDFQSLDPAAAASADPAALRGLIDRMLEFYEEEIGDPFPQDPRVQLEQGARAMAKAWNSPSSRILREAKGAPADAGLGLVIQEVASGFGTGVTGRGEIQLVDSRTRQTGVFRQFPFDRSRQTHKCARNAACC